MASYATSETQIPHSSPMNFSFPLDTPFFNPFQKLVFPFNLSPVTVQIPFLF